MEQQWKYLTPNDQAKMLGVIKDWMPHFAPGAPAALYHYTRGETLIQIIQSGKLWSTHIRCLNDTAEVSYSLEGLRRRIRQRLETAPAESQIEPLLRRFDQVLSDPQFETAPVFVTCFSTLGDDLAQWRGYSGGKVDTPSDLIRSSWPKAAVPMTSCCTGLSTTSGSRPAF